KNGEQTIAGLGAVAVAPWTAEIDNASAFNSTTGEYTISITGIYEISLTLYLTIFPSASAFYPAINLLVNNNIIRRAFAQIPAPSGSSVDALTLPITSTLSLNAGDVISISAQQFTSSSASLRVGTGIISYFSITQIS
ncbi:hypothetical protein, partial [Bacillus toyonensis]|uniref:hypothetical protein n=1 Tax=Bacillus toyonensis TaxID=155322 RepID=UPI0015CF3A33